ncbi:hypothetical protein [Sneathiella chinensis]|uniref:Uncharacterized protein n=1 Tax=Sneathiella chinensis TaxID=349750 RepID=A0ABQ5U3B4_9PROT|nr:hypothetical protein [Sneathiella chinensis]GLQ05733.1 hypothetical protein GCM10007924_09540 [Sneathiella chinensis]
MAWKTSDEQGEPEYFRTRHACLERINALLDGTEGNALLAFDFPLGYPAGSGLGGGYEAGQKIARYLETDARNGNNRFQVANLLNGQFSPQAGPFWGRPKALDLPDLDWRKPPFRHDHFREWRQVEAHLRADGHKIMNVWQLLGQGSVGSQTLTGLDALYHLARSQGPDMPVRFWPFDTGWDKDLNGVILAELWPSLTPSDAIDHPVKDARQVTAARDWLLKHQEAGTLSAQFAAPDWLKEDERAASEKEEGWILGVR